MKHVVTAARVLVTAFGAFPGAPVNPTQAILGRLGDRRSRLARLGIELHEAMIPVAFGSIDETLRLAVAASRPDAILHLGLAARRKTVSVETRAVNRLGMLHPDADGRCPTFPAIVRGAPFILPSTFPSRAIEAAIRGQGVRVGRSIDAGDYVCNATLYGSLLARSADSIGFLHVPRPRGRRPLTGDHDSLKPTIDQLTEAAYAAILLMMRPARLRTGWAASGAPRAQTTDAERGDRPPPAP